MHPQNFSLDPPLHCTVHIPKDVPKESCLEGNGDLFPDHFDLCVKKAQDAFVVFFQFYVQCPINKNIPHKVLKYINLIGLSRT